MSSARRRLVRACARKLAAARTHARPGGDGPEKKAIRAGVKLANQKDPAKHLVNSAPAPAPCQAEVLKNCCYRQFELLVERNQQRTRLSLCSEAGAPAQRSRSLRAISRSQSGRLLAPALPTRLALIMRPAWWQLGMDES